MPQGTNLNISPYYDDFDKTKNYYKVLFKPGFPVQARELTTLQSIFQNQVESFGNYLFKEGSVVIPGGISYQNYFYAVEIQSTFAGIDVNNYLTNLEGKRIKGSSSNIIAKIVKVLPASESTRNSNTLYVMYESSGGSDSNLKQFLDAETLLLQEDLVYINTTISAGEGFAITKSVGANSVASSVTVNSGVYFVRGTFVDVQTQTIILDQYSNVPSYRVGFSVLEQIVTASEDNSLYDNSLGSSNFSAPGADRLKINLILSKKDINDFTDENFIEILRLNNGVPEFFNKDTQLALIKNELAKRTFDESGDYVVSPFDILVKESLNDGISNNGIYENKIKLRNGNTASDDTLIYQIGPGKAYVKGFDINSITSNFLDIKKPRSTKDVTRKEIPFNAGLSVNVNRVFGTPVVGLGTTSVISLRDSRITSIGYSASGNEIGVARLYDFTPNQSYVNDSTQFNLRLFDIQTYTTLTLSSNITLSTPALIQGASSSAKGYLKESVTNSTTLKLYQVSGNFVNNEKLIINGQVDGRLITNVRDYDISDIKSLYSLVGITTFNADIVLDSSKLLSPSGNIFSISASSGGISTISSPGINFVGIVTVGNIISYGNVGTSQTTIIYNRIESIGSGGTSIAVSAVPSVTNVNIGSLPTSSASITNLALVYPTFTNKENSSLYTPLPNSNVYNVNFSNSEVSVKNQFTNRTITASSVSVTITDANLFFADFDGTNYSLIYSDGTIETNLRKDTVVVSNSGKTVTFYALSKVTGTCTITTSLRKLNSTSRNKILNKANTLVISNSSSISSGIGSTTLNDGLTYSNVYGTRVQDEEICLNVCDCLRVLAIYESTTTSDPTLPTLTLNSFTGPNNSTVDYIVGETIKGSSSKSIAIIVSKPSSNTIEIVYLNSNKFQIGEKISSSDSLIDSIISSQTDGSRNITANYNFDNGQTDVIYDYSKIIRKKGISAPTRKIKIIFQNYIINSTDSGDFITASSYSSDDYGKNVLTYNFYRNTDIIDIRPRVSNYNTSSNLSPFEFSSRNFASLGGYSTYTLTPNKNLITNYSYYLPRIDKIYLNKEGNFTIAQGTSADNPEFPIPVNEALEIATIFLPAYLYNTKDARVVISKNKRYTMSDISRLEDRIERTERLTSLSLLEMDAKNFSVKDSITGLDRFKTGIFVDNFKNHNNHDISDDNFRAAIDTDKAELRPQSYSTSLDLQLGSEAINGFTTSYVPNSDLSYVTDLGSSNVQKTGDLVTLTYKQVKYKSQPYATRVENVTPFLVTLWEGTVDTNPSSDNWINEKAITSNLTIGNYDGLVQKLGVDQKTGLSPVDYVGNFKNILNSIDNSVRNAFTDETITSSEAGAQGKTGIQFVVNENKTTKTETKEYTEVIKYLRERNIEFIGKNLKPFTKHYIFFDNVDVSSYIVPKLLEIQMISGTFQIGETVKTSTSAIQVGQPNINFRLCAPNHKVGPYNNPSITYGKNPYDQTDIQLNYSSTSNLLNIDTSSLSLASESSFYGWVNIGMQLVGTSSGAIAQVTNLRLYSDNVGKLIGSLYIPDASIGNYPRFETGTKILRITSSSSNSILNIPGTSESAGESKFIASGLQKTKETINTTIRDAKVTIRSLVPPATAPVYSGGGGGSSPSNDQVFRVYIDRNTGAITQLGYVPPNSGINISGSTSGSTAITFSGGGTSSAGNIGGPSFGTGSATVAASQASLIAAVQAGQITAQQAIEAQIAFKAANGAPAQALDLAAKLGVYCPSRDPLAQTFTVEEESGVFLHSIGVFFYSKDDSLPVTLQIRTVEGGTPTEFIVPFSEVDLEPNEVLTSEDSLAVTSFIFPSPVYLAGGKEYALTLLSNSTNYKVFIARLGETDVTTLALPENKKVIVSKQPSLGSLFKSQNGSTWTPSQYEDLKYVINRCGFTGNTGTVRFFNPKLDIGNDKISKVSSLTTLSRKATIGIGSTGYSSSVVPGVTIVQNNATGKLISIGGSISSTGLINSGIGYTPTSGSFTYNNISFNTNTGNGFGAVGIVTVTNGLVSGVVITNGGTNYAFGDILSVPSIGIGVGTGALFSVTSIGSSNTFNLDNIQGEFVAGITTLSFINSSGVTTYVGAGVTIQSINYDKFNDGLHLIVNQRNHALHSKSNFVTLSDVYPNSSTTKLSSNITNNFVGNIVVDNSSGFEIFEGVGVGSTNPGYLIIGKEIISYTSVNAGVIGIQSRGIDGTTPTLHSIGEDVSKYQFNHISLRRINKTHNFAFVDNPDVHSIDLDNYYIKIDTSSNGIDRSSGSTFGKLYFNSTSTQLSSSARSTENIQFESIIPNFNILNFSGTSITSKIRTVSGTSVSGNEESFLDKGFENISLVGINEFNSPRLVCSQINEQQFLNNIPANKSLTMELTLQTNNDFVSPVIDLQQTGVILTTNRLNNPISDFAKDGRVNGLNSDPHAAIYTSNKVTLKNPADSLKVIISAKLSATNGIRVFYRLFKNDSTDSSQTWQLFPGYLNIDALGNTINPALSNGTPDTLITPETYGQFIDYEYTANNLSQFEGYQIKIDIYGKNQADYPRLSDLRVIATA